MSGFSHDLRFGLRMLRKSPGFTAVAVLTLGLGIGANTVIFSVINAVLLRPLPYKQAGRLVMLWETHPAIPLLQIAVPDFLDWKQQSQSFEQMAAYSFRGYGNLNLSGQGEPEQLQGTLVSEDLFSLLGISPALGRIFAANEDHAVMLSDSLWRRRFGADPSLVGKAIALAGESYSVVGILPRALQFPVWADVWIPLSGMNPANAATRKYHLLEVIARPKPGVTIAQAQAEMATIARRLAAAYPATNNTIGVTAVPLDEHIVGGVRPLLLVLLSAVGLVLLIACGNVANLLLARAAARQREIAIRVAIGAGRGRLVRQFLAESVLLALCGGAGGVLLTLWGVPVLRALAAQYIPRAEEINADVRVLGFTLAVSILTGVLFGLAPAWQASKADWSAALRASASSTLRASASRVLVVGEVALALVVLIGAGLLARSFRQLLRVDPGFRPDHLLTMKISPSGVQYKRYDQYAAFERQLLPKIAALPGVEGAAMSNNLPLGTELRTRTRFAVVGDPLPEAGRFPMAQIRFVSLDYFRVMGIPLLAGRSFQESDSGKPFFIINQTMARRFFPHQNPIGRRVLMGVVDPNPAAIPIVGVVADVRDLGLDLPAEPEIYQASAARPVTLLVRTATDPLSLAGAVRRAVFDLDKTQPVTEIRSMEDLVSGSLARRRFAMLLVGIFSAAGLLLASVGIYGVIAYAVGQRTREMGIRMALGASRRAIFSLVAGQGLMLTLAGVVIGLAAAWASTRLLGSLLYGVSATDPATFLGASVFLTLVAFAACCVPARRATGIDPMAALRSE